MRCLQGWEDALGLAQQAKDIQCLLVIGGDVLNPATLVPVGMLGTNAWIVQSCRTRVNLHCLSIGILKHITQ